MTTNNPPVLVIFPRYSTTEANHYPYWYRVFYEAAKSIPLSLLFESGDQPQPEYCQPFKQVKLQTVTAKPFNLIDRVQIINHQLGWGTKHLFIHYSYASVALVKFLKLIHPLTIYYWNCEEYGPNPQQFWLQQTLNWSDCLVTGSESIASSYRNSFSLKDKPIKIIPNWVERLSGRAVKLPKAKTHILFVHRLSPRKGSRELPEIIKLTCEQLPQVHFHIIGDGPDESWLQTTINQSGLNHRVTLYGALPHHQVVGYYKACDYYIMPSRSEGFPRVILEAMTYKLPFVATNVGNVKELSSTKQKQFLVKAANPKTFTHKLIKLITYPQQSLLIKANQKVAQSYNLDRSVEAFIKLFNK